MNPTIAQEINLFKDFLGQHDDIGIVIGSHQNLDTYAASLALYLSLTQAGKKIQIISKKAPMVEVSNLVGIDKVKENFIGKTTKLVISLPYKKGEVEKVLFTEAPSTINFHLTATAGQSITPFDLSDVKLNWEGGAPQAIITMGVGTIDELAGIADVETGKFVNIDNFGGNTRFGDVIIVDESFSSLSEIVGKVMKDLALPQDVDVAQNILDGVLFATRNFTKPNTSPLAFEAASTAMYMGAQRKAEDSIPQQQPHHQQPRRDQGFQNQPRRDQGQSHNNDRSHRDPRGQQSAHQQPRQNRITDNDFPAMHMQPRPSHQPGQQQSNQNTGHFPNDRRANNPRPNDNRQQFQPRDARQNRPPQQQFGQNPNDVEALLQRIKAENAKHASGGNPQQPSYDRNANIQREPYAQSPINDGEIVDDVQMGAPVASSMNMPQQDIQMPEEQNYGAQSPDEVPDDWLMPKVFKSSKNNN